LKKNTRSFEKKPKLKFYYSLEKTRQSIIIRYITGRSWQSLLTAKKSICKRCVGGGGGGGREEGRS